MLGSHHGRKLKSKAHKPSLAFQPETRCQFQAGANLLINVIRATLGPVARTVLIEQIDGRNKPSELLDNGAIIARRITQLPKRGQDIGAMFVRQMLCTLNEKSIEGTATAAVLFQSIFNQGVRYVEGGGNAMLLRKYLEALIPGLLEDITSQCIHISGKRQMAALAESICHDSALSNMLGEIFDIIGEFGRLEIRVSDGYELKRTYVEGSYWNGALSSRALIEDFKLGCTNFENAAILVTDLDVIEPIELVPVLHAALVAGVHQLVILARNITDRALSILLLPENRQKIQVMVVKTPGAEIESQRGAIEDLAILTGATPLFGAAGDLLEKVTAQHFGYARRIWSNIEHFGIVGGRGDARLLRHHINNLRIRWASYNQNTNQSHLLGRIGTLMGGTATLYIGEFPRGGIDARKLLAERTAAAIRSAMHEGVVPGGGVSLLNCGHLLRKRLAAARNGDERAACQIMLTAIETPMHTMLRNAGMEPQEWMPLIRKAGPNFGFDIVRREIADMNSSYIYDSCTVVKNALSYATFSAALALTVDVLVYRKRRPETFGKT